MFSAPDPGLVRLRVSLRAVAGVGLAVTAAQAAGLPLPASVTGGLAALLALFTVADPTVRGQALTTLLLPVVGLPVLALATVLHGSPLLRDTAWLLVVLGGVYARRWGPRGNALGIFAFMMFFVTQFLHAVPAQLPVLCAAVALALLAAGGVRFGPWCVERRTPPPAAPVPPPGTGPARPTTRQAVQATAACAFALALGQTVSDERWYWAVGTTWWIFVNTASRGETLVRGFRRIVGTVLGIAAGMLVAVPLDGAPGPTAALVAVCVFGIFYTAALSYSWMTFFVTVMAGLLYGLLGVLHPGLLALRLTETVVGAAGAALAVAVVLPVTTHAATDAWIQRALQCVHRCTSEAARRLAGDEDADPAPPAAELEVLLGRVRMSVAPLVHPLNPLHARKARARRVLELLDDCARQVRALAAVAADPDASHDARLTAACRRVETAVHALMTPSARPALASVPVPVSVSVSAPAPAPAAVEAEALVPMGRPLSEEHPALAHLHDLEKALAALDGPLRNPAGPSLVTV
ncbi:FUSC family protein [Streptomyces sp. GC420]|uniref:FUSC family protein n=1 Tax=Streptomyces sp. GC420 TaxID=2697568 RepID=UPI001414CF5F|nr:FUSC family protein [Streptomyces sp. GC420]NBM14616.1 FUSC family protein [Streptomyces sp. GC420]